MGTALALDVTRTELVEDQFTFRRRSADLDMSNGGKNLVYQWPHTQSYTLYPVNFTTDFQGTTVWEQLKFRLSDVVCNTDWWEEVPDNSFNTSDYFFICKVKAANYPTDNTPGPGFALLELAISKTLNRTGQVVNFMDANTVPVMYSRNSLPANQGYKLRWFQEGKPTQIKAAVLFFWFGEFGLRLNGNGMAELYQSPDFVNYYGPVYTFPYAAPTEVHDRYHELVIVPHNRNCIEFLTETMVPLNFMQATFSGQTVGAGVHGGGVFRLPETLFDDDGMPIITKAGTWAIELNREFRAYLQVSKIGYQNGVEFSAGLYDSPIDYGYVPSMPSQLAVDGDLNGCTVDYSLQPVGPTSYQFLLRMQGQGDLCSGKASSTTPEFYGYSVYKPPAFQTLERETVLTLTKNQDYTTGEGADSERLSVTVDNSLGQVDRFARRGDIPLVLYDNETGVTLFEGTAADNDSDEAPGNAPRELAIHASGMVDNGRRRRWTNNPPQFGQDFIRGDPDGKACFWPDTIRFCFRQMGFSDDQVVIEEEDQYSFRLWAVGGSGGPKGGTSKVGSGHQQEGGGQNGWMPNPTNPVLDFIDDLLRGWLGWNYVWDRSDHRWHIYKRPRFGTEVTPKAVFYGTQNARYADTTGLPAYEHRRFKTRTKRPDYSAVFVRSPLNESQYLTRQEYLDALPSLGVGANAEDSRIITVDRIPTCVMTNLHGVFGPLDHPDFIGKFRPLQDDAMVIPNRDAFEWYTRRVFQDNCLGYTWGSLEADWGDPITAYLRKWDGVLVDSGRDANDHPDGSLEEWLIDEIHVVSHQDKMRRAVYSLVLARDDAPPPRGANH